MILFDFEAPGIADQWGTAKGAEISREACESGWCLHVKPVAGSGAGSRRVPADWTGYGELSFRARAAADTSVEVRVPAGEGRAAFWRRVDLKGGAWQDVRLSLDWLRRGEGPAPSWATVKAVSFTFRDATEVWLDDIAVTDGSPVLSAEAVAKVTGGRVTLGRYAAVISLVPDLDRGTLASRLDTVAEAVFADLPFLSAPTAPVPLVVFPDEASYRAGVVQIGAAFAANADSPGHDGFTIEGIATSSWDAAQGIARPVYAHEFVHGLLTKMASLPNRQEWLQESLATWYQLRFYPQPTFAAGLRRLLDKPLALPRLCDGARIETPFYAEAWTVIGTLLEDPKWAGTLPRVFETASRTGSTSLVGMGVDLPALDRDRRAWSARHFGW